MVFWVSKRFKYKGVSAISLGLKREQMRNKSIQLCKVCGGSKERELSKEERTVTLATGFSFSHFLQEKRVKSTSHMYL